MSTREKMYRGRSSGPGLKEGLNSADTSGVVNTVRGYAATGRQRVSGNVPARNAMVSANASRKR